MSGNDIFGDQLGNPMASSLEGFLLEDDSPEVDDENRKTPRKSSAFDDQITSNTGLDSTSGLRGMLQAMEQDKKRDQQSAKSSSKNEAQSLEELLEQTDDDNRLKQGDEDDDLVREEGKEEEYDYFLDAHKDENFHNNPGYHIIDPADLETSENAGQQNEGKGSDVKDQAVDADDLDELQDDELREYRYRNMLEELKESIDQEEGGNEIITRKN